jgi:hypothetical protein
MKSKREGGLVKNTLPQTSLFSQVFQVRSELSAFDRRIHPASGIWVWLSFEGVFEVTNYVWTWGKRMNACTLFAYYHLDQEL